jgi:hypothetical protein
MHTGGRLSPSPQRPGERQPGEEWLSGAGPDGDAQQRHDEVIDHDPV